jgi:xylan 1,4-beta-xylosidase
LIQRTGGELSEGSTNPDTIKLSAQSQGKALHRHWQTCVGAGRANEGLRAGWQEQLKVVVNGCGFRYIRFHGLFHDDMFVYRVVRGEKHYNWMYVDDVFDRLLDSDIRPFVELGFFPRDMVEGEYAKGGGANPFWWHAHIVPPVNFAEWSELVTQTVGHWIERYGLQEVRQWYFEVWNEPNLAAFWRGTQEQYFELYKETAQALKEIDSQLRVGGPATSNFLPREDTVPGYNGQDRNFTTQALRDDAVQWEAVWIEQFLRFCQRENVPVDFV